MGYLTNSDIEERLGSATLVQLADDDGNGIADVGIVDEARLGAEGEVNSYLARRYPTPVDLVAYPELTAVLASITLDLAEYRLRCRRPPVSDDARRRHDEAVDWLTRIADGRVVLPSLTALPASQSAGMVAAGSGEERLLTRSELADF
jgi:phage gp36-like protein